ncbi:MAG: T9SS type A sorting domain-containing protein [Bacteroidia bacterium]|jgi:hypothetical protein
MKTVFTSFFLLLSLSGISQDLRGGYFRLFWIADSTYMLQATLFCDTANEVVRPHCYFNFGDASGENISIVSSMKIDGVLLKTYSRSHFYASPVPKPFLLDISTDNAFWIRGIKNFIQPDSAYLFLYTKIHFKDDIARNRYAPSIGNLPLRLKSNGNQITYNPNCTDADQDSLSYRLQNIHIYNSYIPPQANIDPITGAFTFTTDTPGLYAFKIEITEWRKDSLGVDTINGVSDLAFIIEMNSNTQINELNASPTELYLYPNPAGDILHISYTAYETKNAELTLLNQSGQEVFRGELSESIHISKLPTGIYALQVISGNGNSAVRRFVKN